MMGYSDTEKYRDNAVYTVGPFICKLFVRIRVDTPQIYPMTVRLCG